jgi:fimbrial chaperone protein
MPGALPRFAWGAFAAPLWLAATLLAPCSAARAQVLINPVVVELGARQRAVPITVTLSRNAQAPVVLQSQVLLWEQAADGSARYQPSDELIVAPPIAELKPGESQMFRVALRGPRRHPDELAYRLVLEDTQQAAGGANQGVSFRMRYDLPVLVAPAEPHRKLARWELCAAPAGEICLRLRNEGNRRVALQALTVEGAGWKQPIASPGVVLAGAQREWHLRAPGNGDRSALQVSGSIRGGERFRTPLSPQ